MGEENPMVIFIPRGVAHGYKVLGKKTLQIIYMMTESYDPKKPDEHRIPYDDPSINFKWNEKRGNDGDNPCHRRCGFIGSNFVRHVLEHTDMHVVNYDKLIMQETLIT